MVRPRADFCSSELGVKITTVKHLLTLTALLLASLATLHAAPRAKPNIVFILADDLGFAEISANKADHHKTPNIDSLAKNGVRFKSRKLAGDTRRWENAAKWKSPAALTRMPAQAVMES